MDKNHPPFGYAKTIKIRSMPGNLDVLPIGKTNYLPCAELASADLISGQPTTKKLNIELSK
jgi:hypothetical protein